MSYGLGVDLGTSFTGAAISQSGQPQMVTLGDDLDLMPSVVRVQQDGSLTIGDASSTTTGSVAMSLGTVTTGTVTTRTTATLTDDPTRTGRDFKRRLGDPTPLVLGGQPHSAASLLAATLKSVIETVTAAEGAPPDRVVLTYPAVWGPYRREQFAEVPRRAGLDDNVVTVTTEPEAAATRYASRQALAAGAVIAVYDLGGGTFDTTVTRVTAGSAMEILGVPEGVEWVGGVDFDEAILAYVDKATGGAVSALDARDPAGAGTLQRLRQECVRAKELLSTAERTSVVVDLPGRRTEVPLTRAQFEDMIRTPLEATLTALRRTLTSAGIAPADLAGILLVGGSSRIPLVARMLTEDLGRPVLLDPEPQHCVALGAAALAEQALTSVPTSPPTRRPKPPAPWLTRGPLGHGQLRNRMIAASAVAALLVGGAIWITRQPQVPVAEATPRSTASPTPPPATRIGSATTTQAPSPSPTKPAKQGPSRAKLPPLPFTSAVLGLDAKCMDIANALTMDGTAVEIFGCNGTDAQHWTFGKDGTVRAMGKCMGVGAPLGRAGEPASAGDSGSTGLSAQLQDCDGSSGQRWKLEDDALVSQKSKLCLDVLNQSTADRTPLALEACKPGPSQTWTVPPVPSSINASASLGTPKVAKTIHGLGHRPQGIAVSPDGTRVYVPSITGNTLSVIDTRSGDILRTIQMPAAPQYIAAAPDGRRLYVTLDDPRAPTNSIQVVDAVTGQLLNRIKIGKTLFPPAVSPNGLLLYVPNQTVSQIEVIDTTTYQPQTGIVVAAAPQNVVFAPDGRHAYTADNDTGLVSVLDVPTSAESATIPAGPGPVGLAVSPDGQEIAVTQFSAGSVSLIDVDDDQVSDTVKVGKNPRSLAFAPDGNHLYVANDGSNTLSVIDVQTGRLCATVPVGTQPWAVAVSPNGKRAYVSNARSNTVTVLKTAD